MSPNLPLSRARRVPACAWARAAALLAAVLAVRPLPGAAFIRGDATRDGRIDITDPLLILNHLFRGVPLSCPDGGDFDDSGRLDISDPVRALEFLFLGGPAPAGPYPDPGLDPTPDSLPCAGEPDAGEEPAPTAKDLADVLNAAASLEGLPVREESGRPLHVDAQTFRLLEELRPGDSILGAPGLDGEALLAAFFQGRPGDGPLAVAVDVVAAMGYDRCFRIPPGLVGGGSRLGGPGTFLRGDVDGNGVVEAKDGELLAGCLAGGGLCPESCWDAADADDDGRVGPPDVEAIVLHALGEVRLPPPLGCVDDPTPDDLPVCRWLSCSRDPCSLELSVEPEVVCGPGPHPVKLEARDPYGNVDWDFALVTLCIPGAEGCPRFPQAAPPRHGREDRPTAACRWVVATDYQPPETESYLRQKVFGHSGNLEESRHAPPLKTHGAMEIYRTDVGPGPDHLLYGSRLDTNCATPETELAVVKSGKVQVRVNLVCLELWGTLLSCQGKVEVEGIYRSLVEVATSVGSDCRSVPNRVEGLAQDEALLSANSSTLFQKAVAVQNGTTITTTPSFSSDLSFGGGQGGLAAAAGVHFGYSHTTTHRTGRAEDELSAFANAPADLPLTINLWAKGRLELMAHRVSSGRVKVRTLVAGVWLVGKTDCPVEAPLFLSAIQGEGVHKAHAQELSKSFRRTRLGH